MNRLWHIIRYEIIAIITNLAYMSFAIGFPLIVVLIFLLVTVVKDDGDDGTQSADQSTASQTDAEGYVDLSGIITSLPNNVPDGRLIQYSDESAAKSALESEQIAAYYLIPVDYVESGDIVRVVDTYNPFEREDGTTYWIEWALLVNMLDGQVRLAEQVWNPAQVSVESVSEPIAEEDCSRPGTSCISNEVVRLLPIFMVMLLYILVIIPSGQLLKSLSKEKENRVMEVLITSTSPQKLLAGKIIALGIIGFVQTVGYLAVGYGMLHLGGHTLNLPDDFEFPPSLVVWSIVFIMMGYALYACMMAAAGVLVPDSKGSASVTMIVIAPLFAGYFASLTLGFEHADSLTMKGLSFFPLTSPIAMVQRITNSDVAFWQPILAVILLVAFTYYVARVTANMFHAQHLLSGQPFSAKRYYRMLLGRS